MINNPIIFYLASFFIIVFAFITLFAKNVIYSLLSAVMVFFFGALFFYMLGSEYNAIIQAAIYGLAVPIIIGVSIMFAPTSGKVKDKSFVTPYVTFMSAALFVLAFVYLVLMSLAMMPDTFRIMDVFQVNAFDAIKSFAKLFCFNLLSKSPSNLLLTGILLLLKSILFSNFLVANSIIKHTAKYTKAAAI